VLYTYYPFHITPNIENYTLSLHDALPILKNNILKTSQAYFEESEGFLKKYDFENKKVYFQKLELFEIQMLLIMNKTEKAIKKLRSEEHTSELQSRENLVCRLLLEKKKTK